MLTNLDLGLLRTFVAIVDGRTFAAAAATLALTQAAISQQMQRLEAQIGASLFRRQGRNKHLTEHGVRLLHYARDMLSLNDEAIRTLGDSRLRGALRIGSPHDVADTLLPPILSQLARSAPDVRLEIDVGRSPTLMEALHRGEIDMTISTREDASLESIVLQSSPVVWVCSSQFTPRRDHPWPLVLIDEPSIFRRLAIEALDRHKVPWRQAYRSSNLIGIKAALRANLGITARSMEFLKGSDMRMLGLRDGLPEMPPVTYYLLRRPGGLNSLAARAFALLGHSGLYAATRPPAQAPGH